MRLIDADKAAKEIANAEPSEGRIKSGADMVDYISDLGRALHVVMEQESIDAIPIEFIQKRAEEKRRRGEAKLLQSTLIEAETLEELIDDWRAEK